LSKLIFIITSEFPPGPGGIGQHAFSLSKALVGVGNCVKVLSPADYANSSEISSFDNKQQFEILRYPRLKGLKTYSERLRITLKEIKKHIPSSIILTGKFSLWQGFFIKLFYPTIKTIAVLHGSEVNLSNKIFRLFTHFSISRADVLVPVSQFTKSLLPLWILNKHKFIKIIPNGIDLPSDTFFSNSSVKLNGYPVLLTVGHVTPRKGQHRLIKALPTLIKQWPTLHYHIVGQPNNRDLLSKLAISLNVQNSITFHGQISNYDDLNSYYSQADVFILLSENQHDGDVEGFGIVALEANLRGVPVIGAKYCGVEEAVSHKQSGFLVDGNLPNEILDAVNFCLSNRDRIRIEAVKWAQKHEWPLIVTEFKELLD
jgi:phosphatidylinositol alpha-1,6-mannosyltransferase